MKAYVVAALLVSTFLTSFVDTGHFSSVDYDTEFLKTNNSECGPKTFSNNVKKAFQKESNLEQYSSSEIYLSNQWVVLFKHPYCNQDLDNLIDLSLIENIEQFSILTGVWILTFQTGDFAITHLSEMNDRGYLWNYYPLIKKEVSLKSQPNDSNFSKQWYLNNNGQNNGTVGVDLNIDNVWDEYAGDGVVIGIVDDGIDYTHPDISPNFKGEYSKDFC